MVYHEVFPTSKETWCQFLSLLSCMKREWPTSIKFPSTNSVVFSFRHYVGARMPSPSWRTRESTNNYIKAARWMTFWTDVASSQVCLTNLSQSIQCGFLQFPWSKPCACRGWVRSNSKGKCVRWEWGGHFVMVTGRGGRQPFAFTNERLAWTLAFSKTT